MTQLKIRLLQESAVYRSVDLATMEVSPYQQIVLEQLVFTIQTEIHFNSQFINKSMYGKIKHTITKIN